MRSLFIVLVLLLTGLTFYSALWFKSETIQADVLDRVTQSVNDAGGENVDVTVDGRHATLTGIVFDADQESAFLDTADETWGALGPIDGLTYRTDTGHFVATKDAAGISLSGTVPSEEARADLIDRATAATSGTVTESLTVAGPEAPWQDEARFGLGQMASLSTGTLTASAANLALSGVSDGDAEAAKMSFADRDGWNLNLTNPIDVSGYDSQISQLNGDLADRDANLLDLSSQRDELQAQLDLKSTERNGLFGHLRTRTAERDALASQLAGVQAGLTQTEAETAASLSAANNQIATYEGIVSDQDATIVGLNSQIDTLKRDITGLEGQVANVSSNVDDTSAQVADLNALVAERDVQLVEKSTEVTGLQARVGTLETELAARDEALGENGSEVEALRSALETRSAELSDSTTEVTTLSGRIDVLETEVGDLQSKLENANGQVSSSATLADDQSNMIATLKADLASTESTLEDRAAEVDAMAASVAAAGAQIAERDQTIVGLSADIDVARGTIAERDATILALQNATPTVVNNNVDQCAVRANAALEGSRINFRSATSEISEESVELLERLTGIALACLNNGTSLEIGGHTDNQGDEASNEVLSEARAQAVVDFMSARGVPTDNLLAKGYGEVEPVADNETPEGRAENRRISFAWQSQ